ERREKHERRARNICIYLCPSVANSLSCLSCRSWLLSLLQLLCCFRHSLRRLEASRLASVAMRPVMAAAAATKAKSKSPPVSFSQAQVPFQKRDQPQPIEYAAMPRFARQMSRDHRVRDARREPFGNQRGARSHVAVEQNREPRRAGGDEEPGHCRQLEPAD